MDPVKIFFGFNPVGGIYADLLIYLLKAICKVVLPVVVSPLKPLVSSTFAHSDT